MTTLNERLRQASVKHQVDLSSIVAPDVAERTLRLLTEGDRRVIRLIQRVDLQTRFGQRRLQQLLTKIRDENRQQQSEMNALLRDEVVDLAMQERDFNEELLLGLLLLLPGRPKIPGSREVLDDALSAEYRGTTLTSGTKTDHIREFYRRRGRALRDDITLAFGTGQSTSTLLTTIRRQVVPRFRRELDNIAKSTVTHVGNQVARTFARAQGDTFKLRWDAILDAKTCPICAARHGMLFSPSEGPRPPAHPNCRCIMRMVVDGGGAANGSQTFDAWLRTQPVKIQERVLGVTKSKLFRQGVRIERFVDRPRRASGRSREFTLDELRASNDETLREAFNQIE